MEKSRVQEAIKRHKSGYNCSQAVVCTYCDLLGVDEETAFKFAEGYGAGISALQETCGCVSAMIMLAGLKNSDCNLENHKSNPSTYAVGKDLAMKFKDKNSTIVCRELKGIGTDTGVIRTCPGCVEDAAKIVEEKLFPDVFN